ncbi:acetolactate synthase large subunit [Promicromonospora sp. NPDC052451]|uniref:acetolactate synthase large subunit n=1 Tax=Promicromonospora sp. NPDC052451 TaxID=3364407 RepID=UPI0037C62EAA
MPSRMNDASVDDARSESLLTRSRSRTVSSSSLTPPPGPAAGAVTGAEALLRSLCQAGVDVCFTNPGTSEMHTVAALDAVPQMRGILCLFEGVATGAADGFARMTGRPAASLLHLGPGLANGVANLHNARRAHSPQVVVVGDHTDDHKALDSPLESDIIALAATCSRAVRRVADVDDVGPAVVAAVAASRAAWAPADDDPTHVTTGTSGRVSTLVVPADVSWSTGARDAAAVDVPATAVASDESVVDAAVALRSGRRAVLLLGGGALGEPGLRAASRIARATGTRLLGELWPARRRQGAGVPAVEPLAYRSEAIARQLHGTELLLLAGTGVPVPAFAYPGVDSRPAPHAADRMVLGGRTDIDVEDALVRLAGLVADGVEPEPAAPRRPETGSGVLTPSNWAPVIGALLPPDAVISDESVTSGMVNLNEALSGAPAHDILGLTGLAIGQGLPVATGAAVACPDRPVICLQADGSAMYTIQALWTQARERLDVTTVILSNRSYAILRTELERVGAPHNGAAARLMNLDDPALDFVALATGMGVPASRATTVEELYDQFRDAVATPGPHLIEAVLAPA